MSAANDPRPHEEGEHFVFGGRGLESLFGLGALHALYTTGSPPPRSVAGSSLGALHAAALRRFYTLPPGERERYLRSYVGFWLEDPAEVLFDSLPSRHDLGLAQHDLPEAHGITAHRESWTVLLNRLFTLRLSLGQILSAIYDLLRIRTLLLQGGSFLQIYPPFVWSLLRLSWRAPALAISMLMLPARRSVAAPFSRERFSLRLGSRRLTQIVYAISDRLETILWAVLILIGSPLVTALCLLLLLPLAFAVLGFAGQSLVRKARTERRARYLFPGLLAYVVGALALGVTVVPILPLAFLLGRFLKRVIEREAPAGSGASSKGFERLLDALLLRLRRTESLREGILHPDALRRPLARFFSTVDAPDDVGPTLHVVAADLEACRVELVAKDAPLLERLLAAVSKPPWVPAVSIGRARYVDAGDTEHAPLDLLVRHLARSGVAFERAPRVFVYYGVAPETPWPEGRAEAQLPSAARVYAQGQRLLAKRDLLLDLRFTETLNDLIDEVTGEPRARLGGRNFLAIDCVSLFPDADVAPSWSRFTSGRGRSDAARAIADGCRKTLAARHPDVVRELAAEGETSLDCATLRHRMGATAPFREICEHCSKRLLVEAREPELVPRVLTETGDMPFAAAHVPTKDTTSVGARTALVLSGGVFKGVLQVGVIGALHARGLIPRVIAGSSVGAITAVCAKATFDALASGTDRRNAPGLATLHTLAAVYLDLEGRVVTDRFMEAFQRFYRRAHEVDASLHDLDQSLRRYGEKRTASVERRRMRLRQAAEMIFGITPSRFDRLTETLRSSYRRGRETVSWTDLVERAFELYGWHTEILGSEKLERELLQAITAYGGAPSASDLVLTATRLATGEESLLLSTERTTPQDLVLFALVSSAYPGAFRVRRETELFPLAEAHENTYTDGGLLNNQPVSIALEALAMQRAVDDRGLASDSMPDLVLVPTLQVPPRWDRCPERDVRMSRFPMLEDRRAAKRLAHNRKVRKFERTWQRVRILLRESVRRGIRTQVPYAKVLPIYPERMDVGAFEFCFELGFDARKQIETIAHACHSTIEQLQRFEDEALSGYHRLDPDPERPAPIATTYATHPPGIEERVTYPCHHDARAACPFHPDRDVTTPGGLTRDTLERIYARCRRDTLHETFLVSLAIVRPGGEVLLMFESAGARFHDAWILPTVEATPVDDGLREARALARDVFAATPLEANLTLLEATSASTDSYEGRFRVVTWCWRVKDPAVLNVDDSRYAWWTPREILERTRDVAREDHVVLHSHTFRAIAALARLAARGDL